MASMVYVTVKDIDEAKKIANHLLDHRLIACANIFPIRSIYVWKGKVEDDPEVAMIIKTRSSLVDRIMKEIKKIHSYEVPCIVSYDIIKGDKDFLNWIRDETDVVTDLKV